MRMWIVFCVKRMMVCSVSVVFNMHSGQWGRCTYNTCIKHCPNFLLCGMLVMCTHMLRTCTYISIDINILDEFIDLHLRYVTNRVSLLVPCFSSISHQRVIYDFIKDNFQVLYLAWIVWYYWYWVSPCHDENVTGTADWTTLTGTVIACSFKHEDNTLPSQQHRPVCFMQPVSHPTCTTHVGWRHTSMIWHLLPWLTVASIPHRYLVSQWELCYYLNSLLMLLKQYWWCMWYYFTLLNSLFMPWG